MSWDEWALDVTCWPAYCFVPIENDELWFGINMIQERSPGRLVAVIHEDGQESVESWVESHPDWRTRFAHRRAEK